MNSPMRRPISDGDRERSAELLQRACGDGRLTLEEFGARVSAVWAAEDEGQLEKAVVDLAPAPVVGSAQAVDNVVTVFSESKRRGRWRLRSPRMRTWTIFGSTQLDLRDAITDQRTIEIAGGCLFGELKVIVPEGVEVDLTGWNVFSARNMHLAAVPRVPGTPEIHVKVSAWFGSVEVISQPYALPG